MDLLGALRAAQHLQGLANEVRRPMHYAWEHDEEAFVLHFGVPFDAYAEIVARLDPEQAHLLENTLNVNPEAAVLWILAMEEVVTG